MANGILNSLPSAFQDLFGSDEDELVRRRKKRREDQRFRQPGEAARSLLGSFPNAGIERPKAALKVF